LIRLETSLVQIYAEARLVKEKQNINPDNNVILSDILLTDYLTFGIFLMGLEERHN